MILNFTKPPQTDTKKEVVVKKDVTVVNKSFEAEEGKLKEIMQALKSIEKKMDEKK